MKSELGRAKADLAAATKETLDLRKELTELKLTADQLRVEATSAKAILETEKAIGLRLRTDLDFAREQIAYLDRFRPAGVPPAPTLRPQPLPR